MTQEIHHPLRIFPVTDVVIEGICAYMIAATMFCGTSFNAVNNETWNMSSMLSLFHWFCPFAVSWFIIAIVIYSMDTVLRRWFAFHISEEVQIGIKPSLADFDTSSAVIRILWVAGVATSIFDMCITTVFRRFTIAFPMDSLAHVWNRNSFAMQASARLTLSRRQHSGFNTFFFAADTTADPGSTSDCAAQVLLDDDPSSESASCELLNWSHKYLYHK